MGTEIVAVYRANAKESGDRKACPRCENKNCPNYPKDIKKNKNRQCKPGCPGDVDKNIKGGKDAKGGKDTQGGKDAKGGKNYSKSLECDGTLDQVGDSVKVHGKECCQALADYIKELVKLIWCVSGSSPSTVGDTRLGEVFCQLMDATYALGKDAFCLVRFLIDRLCVCMKKANPN